MRMVCLIRISDPMRYFSSFLLGLRHSNGSSLTITFSIFVAAVLSARPHMHVEMGQRPPSLVSRESTTVSWASGAASHARSASHVNLKGLLCLFPALSDIFVKLQMVSESTRWILIWYVSLKSFLGADECVTSLKAVILLFPQGLCVFFLLSSSLLFLVR